MECFHSFPCQSTACHAWVHTPWSCCLVCSIIWPVFTHVWMVGKQHACPQSSPSPLMLDEHLRVPHDSKHPCYSHQASPWPSVYPSGCTFQAGHKSNTFRHPATCGRAIRIVLHSPSHHSLRIITTRCGTAASILILLACPVIYACTIWPWWCLPGCRC